MSSVSSMDPVGMTNACTNVVVPNSRSRMVMAHSAMVPRGGSGFRATSMAGAGSTTAVLLRSEVAFIKPVLLVYQHEGGEDEALRRARCRYLRDRDRSNRPESKNFPKSRAPRGRI